MDTFLLWGDPEDGSYTGGIAEQKDRGKLRE